MAAVEICQLWEISKGFETIPKLIIQHIRNGKSILFRVCENSKQDFLHLHGDVLFRKGNINLFRWISLKII